MILISGLEKFIWLKNHVQDLKKQIFLKKLKVSKSFSEFEKSRVLRTHSCPTLGQDASGRKVCPNDFSKTSCLWNCEKIVLVFSFFIFLKNSNEFQNILMFFKPFGTVWSAQQISMIDFWKHRVFSFFLIFLWLFLEFHHFDKSLYEPSRQWLGWQFTGGPKYEIGGIGIRHGKWHFFFFFKVKISRKFWILFGGYSHSIHKTTQRSLGLPRDAS